MKFIKIEKVALTDFELTVWDDMRELLYSLEEETGDEVLAEDAARIRQLMDYFVREHLG